MKGRLRQLSSDYVLRLERSYPALNYSLLNDDAEVMSIAGGGDNNDNNNSINSSLVVDGSNINNNNDSSSSVMYDENALILSLLPDEVLTPFSLYGHTSIGLPIETRGVGIGGGGGLGIGGRGMGTTGGGFGVGLNKEQLEQCFMIITPLSEHTLWTGGLLSYLHTSTYPLTHTLSYNPLNPPYQHTLSHTSSHIS